ncbi:MAG: hypothetical protein HPY30_06830 [Gammaproteobacteria bacterium (ex Lamellibrachia satsuma)]|nr:MAG: hypothetical protein HPY30_06830 [Gammaproteobacteria bacterium (ex Lamellibrachia satsuma)]
MTSTTKKSLGKINYLLRFYIDRQGIRFQSYCPAVNFVAIGLARVILPNQEKDVFGDSKKYRGTLHFVAALIVGCSSPFFSAALSAADEVANPASVTHQMWRKIRLGELKIEGDYDAVKALVLQGNIPITYDYIATLMRTPNAFGNGPACIVCHSSNDPSRSYRGLDLSSCEGILRGSTEAPARPVISPGKPMESRLVHKLRNNRMPLGVSFLHPTDTDSIQKVKKWIDSGAADDEFFKTSVLPLFVEPTAFGSDIACISCHAGFRDPPNFNEVNLSSHEAIMTGAFSRTNKKQGRPGIPIVIPHEAEKSRLYQRLTENRMPPGINPGEESDHPNTSLLMRWIEQGAWCK